MYSLAVYPGGPAEDFEMHFPRLVPGWQAEPWQCAQCAQHVGALTCRAKKEME